MISVTDKETIISYFGMLEYETIGDILHKLKEETSKLNVKLALYKKLLTAAIESLENIYKYSEYFEKEFSDKDKHYPRFIVEMSESAFYITAGNPIRKDHIEKLAGKLNKINNLDKDGLRSFYKETITNGEFSKKGGAGLGFIEMAKISGGGLEFDFIEINDEFSYFKLNYIIPFEK